MQSGFLMASNKKVEEKQTFGAYKRDIPVFRKLVEELGLVGYQDTNADLFRKLLNFVKKAQRGN